MILLALALFAAAFLVTYALLSWVLGRDPDLEDPWDPREPSRWFRS